MKLLLQRNIEYLGRIGDIVEVAPGYARNFLLPTGLAVELTKDNLNRFESMRRRLIAEEQENKAKKQLMARELDKASCTIIANSTEEGHLYGSVTARDIATQLESEGLSVDPKSILLESPIKELGIYEVKIRLHPEVESTTKVWVVKGDSSSPSKKAADQPELTAQDEDTQEELEEEEEKE